MSFKMSNGVSDFPKIRAENACYVDKTGFLDTFLRNHFQVSLFLRPPGFGKSLLLSMLDSFFDCMRDDGEELFAPYAICEASPRLCAGLPPLGLGKTTLLSIWDASALIRRPDAQGAL